jgi:hypothetical protein
VFLATSNATFDSTGKAVAVVGPIRARENWDVKQLVTRTTSSSQTRLTVYRYNESGPKLDTTSRANNDVSPCDYHVPSGQKLAFVWTGGTVGTIATIDIDGERYGV